MTRITSVKTQCNKSLNDLCEIQYKRGTYRAKAQCMRTTKLRVVKC